MQRVAIARALSNKPEILLLGIVYLFTIRWTNWRFRLNINYW